MLVFFQASPSRPFTPFYQGPRRARGRAEFPGLPRYPRLVELIPRTGRPLCAYRPPRRGHPPGIPFIDSLPIRVGHHRRLPSPQVLAGLAPRGPGRRGWFYGFKRPWVIKEQGEVRGLTLTPGNPDDRRPAAKRVRPLWGQLLGDRGSLSQELFEPLWAPGWPFITKLKRNMKNKLMPVPDKGLWRKRALREGANDQLKNISPIEHTRPRRATNGIVNRRAAVGAYTFQAKNPALDLLTKPARPDQQLL
jgi:hypothetical protein